MQTKNTRRASFLLLLLAGHEIIGVVAKIQTLGVPLVFITCHFSKTQGSRHEDVDELLDEVFDNGSSRDLLHAVHDDVNTDIHGDIQGTRSSMPIRSHINNVTGFFASQTDVELPLLANVKQSLATAPSLQLVPLSRTRPASPTIPSLVEDMSLLDTQLIHPSLYRDKGVQLSENSALEFCEDTMKNNPELFVFFKFLKIAATLAIFVVGIVTGGGAVLTAIGLTVGVISSIVEAMQESAKSGSLAAGGASLVFNVFKNGVLAGFGVDLDILNKLVFGAKDALGWMDFLCGFFTDVTEEHEMLVDITSLDSAKYPGLPAPGAQPQSSTGKQITKFPAAFAEQGRNWLACGAYGSVKHSERMDAGLQRVEARFQSEDNSMLAKAMGFKPPKDKPLQLGPT